MRPELQALVDAGVITPAQASEASRAAPAPDEFMGFARCMTTGCPEAETDRPLALRRTRSQVMAPDLPLVINQTDHIEVVDDHDLVCPECGQSCAILQSRPPTYQKQFA
jgi:hypothetical protein